MSSGKKDIYSKALLFTVVAAITVLIGTIVTVFYPMMLDSTNPKLANVHPYTALQLAGRDLYQKEGCVNCHSQVVRPLKAEVLRYGDYSKTGEYYYDRPFLWGSKRTGPDLARIGGKYPDEWHIQHFTDPQAFYPKSNMPKYYWFNDNKLDAREIKAHMDTLGFPYTEDEIKELENLTEMDAIVAYMQVLGTAIEKKPVIEVDESMIEPQSPFAGKVEAASAGAKLYKMECAGCHGQNAEGNIGTGFADIMEGEPSDTDLYLTVANGIEETMPGYATQFTKEQIWQIVEFIKSKKPKE
jgi:cytochrome c oxidase cbb3-type subunit 2